MFLTEKFIRQHPPGTRLRHPFYGVAAIKSVHPSHIVVEWESPLAAIEQPNRIPAHEVPYLSRLVTKKRLSFESIDPSVPTSGPSMPAQSSAFSGSPPDDFMNPSSDAPMDDDSDTSPPEESGSDTDMAMESRGQVIRLRTPKNSPKSVNNRTLRFNETLKG